MIEPAVFLYVRSIDNLSSARPKVENETPRVSDWFSYSLVGIHFETKKKKKKKISLSLINACPFPVPFFFSYTSYLNHASYFEKKI
jgi:hypothetical protein